MSLQRDAFLNSGSSFLRGKFLARIIFASYSLSTSLQRLLISILSSTWQARQRLWIDWTLVRSRICSLSVLAELNNLWFSVSSFEACLSNLGPLSDGGLSSVTAETTY
jgi:hypothetical protein